jgi:hypothetical protein
MILDTLKKQYDGQKINDIESTVTRYHDLSAANRKDFILGLYYLDRTKRYKENKVYKNATFEKYIGNLYSLKRATYDKERFAFIAHPEAAEKYGPGLVARIKDDCGADRVVDVVKKIEDAKDIGTIDKIIVKNAKKQPEPKNADTKSEPPKKVLERENANQVKTIADYLKTIHEQDEQIQKLTDTVEKLKAENATLKAENATLKAENARYKSDIGNIASNNSIMAFITGLKPTVAQHGMHA